jgi:D-arabinose 1-dehydrogenase-like Zn-dependent alcohol dehydrogenase
VLVKINSCGVCHTDLHVIKSEVHTSCMSRVCAFAIAHLCQRCAFVGGHIETRSPECSQVPFPRPAVMGHEISGEIVAHGPGSPAAQLEKLPVGTKAVGAFIMPCLSPDCFFCAR